MNNYISPGATRTWTNGTGVDKVSGQVVVVGKQLGICTGNIANGATGEVAFEGRFNVPKLTTAVILHGEMVMWDASAANFDDSAAIAAAGDVTNAAIACEDAGNGVTDIDIQLNNRLGVVA
jgi:predicted RecA/RadA family phage recombinase